MSNSKQTRKPIKNLTCATAHHDNDGKREDTDPLVPPGACTSNTEDTFRPHSSESERQRTTSTPPAVDMATRKAERPYPRGLCPSSAPYRPSMNSSQQRYVGAEEGIRKIVIVHRSERICHSPTFFSLTCHHCDVHLQSALDDAFLLERFHLLVDSSLHRHHLLYVSSPPPVATPQRGHLRVVPLLL